MQMQSQEQSEFQNLIQCQQEARGGGPVSRAAATGTEARAAGRRAANLGGGRAVGIARRGPRGGAIGTGARAYVRQPTQGRPGQIAPEIRARIEKLQGRKPAAGGTRHEERGLAGQNARRK